MPRFIVQKLLRDKLALTCEWEGLRQLDTNEYIHELKRKLLEESEEVIHAKTSHDLIEEMADVQEVLDALIDALGLSKKELENVQKDKVKKKEAFAGRYYAEATIIDNGDPLLAHCREHPDKYTEISD